MSAKQITSDSFERDVLGAGTPVLVDFWAEWCQPCRLLGPVIDEIASEYEGRVVVGKADVDREKDLAVKYGISSIPTVLLFVDGKVAETFIGLRSKDDFVEAIERALAGTPA